ncbi:MAG: metallophosphoesterase [Planctomycetales bacterium]|nr:metallophosphoesterase [Planctomycetales bacterium]
MVASHQYVENILTIIDEAAEANRQTPGRQGCTVALTGELAEEVMVTGDVHGHRRNFNSICKIAALEEHPRRHLVLQEVCHGGPAYEETGGCMSHAILEDVAALKVKFPQRVHFLLGNHEMAELSDYPIQKNRQLLNLLFRLGLQQMYGPAADDVHKAMLRFLLSCPLAVRLPWGAFISHSLPEEADRRGFDPAIFERELTADDCLEQSDAFRLLWGRDYRRENAKAFCELVGAKMLVTGHEPCQEGFVAPNQHQIILDCCGPAAAYVILPVGTELSHSEVMERVKMVGEIKNEE